MKTFIRFVVGCSCLMLTIGMSYGYTSNETNEVVKALLFGSWVHHDNSSEPLDLSSVPDFRSPDVFFGLQVEGGWTRNEKQGAFDAYLAGMGSRDYTSESNAYYTVTELAVSQCEFMHYTNSVPDLKDLIRNPTCSSRVRLHAIHAVIPMLTLSDDETLFIESIFTNMTAYSNVERGTSSGSYIERLISNRTNGVCSATVVATAARRLYVHRKCDNAGSVMFDRLFASGIEGYASSSNRLDFALFMINHPNSEPEEKEEFSSVTNQLLSSGQQLQWINVGGNNP